MPGWMPGWVRLPRTLACRYECQQPDQRAAQRRAAGGAHHAPAVACGHGGAVVVYETLRQLGAEGKPVITVFNKQDKLETQGCFRDFHAEYSIPVSAKTEQGLEELKEALLEILRRDQVYIERLYSFAEAGKIQLIRTQGQLLSEEYVPDGIEVKAYVPKEIWGKV